MRSLKKSPARRWFMANLNELKSGCVPKNIITELRSYCDEEIYELSCEMIDYRFLYKFEDCKGVNKEENDEILIRDDEYDEFIELYYQKHFSDLPNRNAMIEFLIDKLCIVLKVIIMSSSGDVIIQNNFNLWDVVERKVDLLCTKSRRTNGRALVKRNRVQEFNWRGKFHKEVAMRETISQALSKKDFGEAQRVLREHNTIIQMMGN